MCKLVKGAHGSGVDGCRFLGGKVIIELTIHTTHAHATYACEGGPSYGSRLKLDNGHCGSDWEVPDIWNRASCVYIGRSCGIIDIHMYVCCRSK